MSDLAGLREQLRLAEQIGAGDSGCAKALQRRLDAISRDQRRLLRECRAIALVERGDWEPLEDAYETLLPNEQRVLGLRYGLRPSDSARGAQDEAAADLGCSRSSPQLLEQ